MNASVSVIGFAASELIAEGIDGLDPEADIGFFSMSPSSAEQVTVQIRTVLDRAWEYIALAYKGRAFVALGYSSWDEYVDARFGDFRLAVPREHRAQVVTALAGVRMSVRAIAKLLGVGIGTVHRELARSSGVPTGTPDESNGQPSTLGRDGKEYRRQLKPVFTACRTCGEQHPADTKSCPWDLFAQGLGPHPRGHTGARVGDDITYGNHQRNAAASKPGSPKVTAVSHDSVDESESVDAVANSGEILGLVERAECVLEEMAELQDLVVTIASAVASHPVAIGTHNLSARIRMLSESLRDGIARLPALSDRLGRAAMELGTH